MKTFVSAIVISHDSPEFLSRTLASLQKQPIDELIHVETSSVANQNSQILSLPNASLAKSLALAVSKTSEQSEWLWILHDDSAPLPGALEAMLAIAETSPSVAAIVCAHWATALWLPHRQRLLTQRSRSPANATAPGLDRAQRPRCARQSCSCA